MPNNVTLEQVEQLAAQLPQREQLKLLSRLSERLTETIFPSVTANKRERMQEAAAILRECDRAAAAFTRKTNSLDNAGVQIIYDPRVKERARQIARQLNQRCVYDSTYAALAELRGCEFCTADKAFYDAVKAVLTFVKYLPDYQ